MTLNVEKNTQLTRFRAQYLQLLDPRTLSWPPHTTLKRPDVQAWLFKNLFDKQNLQYLPSDRYQTRVLKMVLARIEESIEDPDQDVSAITSNPV
jgi:protein-lysine N-methyltransferase EEF2KMT